MRMKDRRVADTINSLARICHRSSKEAGWWDNSTGMSEEDFLLLMTPVKLALIHSEVSEALEGFRKDLMDDKLPDRKMAEVELADVLIRVFDLAGAHGMDLGGAMLDKFNMNQTREDHTREARADTNGKKY